jgi:hypothetical protein
MANDFPMAFFGGLAKPHKKKGGQQNISERRTPSSKVACGSHFSFCASFDKLLVLIAHQTFFLI